MSEPQDDAAASGFPKPAIELGKWDKLELLDGARVYHAGSPYPAWQYRDRADEEWQKAKPFFDVDAYLLRHQKFDGTMSEPMVREVFERGDSVGVLLYNRDTDKVICVEQFRLPTYGRGEQNGWIVETVAGAIREGETPEQTAVRETEEETGYHITKPELVSKFFSSPGGTSEVIHLFFAEVNNRQRSGRGRRDPSEDINLVEYSLDEFRRRITNREFVDPKLVIAAYYLQVRLRLSISFAQPLAAGDGPVYELSEAPGFKVGIRAGDILDVTGVDVWLNPENRYMMMSRVIDEGISASVRWGGAKKYSDGSVESDLIGHDMQLQMAGRSEARPTEIIETTPGELNKLGVRRLLHLPVAEANAGQSDGGLVRARKGLRAKPQDLRPMVYSALSMIHEGNVTPTRALVRLREYAVGRGWYCESVLVPLLGTGEGRLSPREAVPEIIAGVMDFAQSYPRTRVRRIHLLAYYPSDLDECKLAIEATRRFTETHW